MSAWFYIYLCGIKFNPDCKNINNLVLSPNFVKGLSHVKGEYVSEIGKISIEWKRINDTVEFTYSAPQNIKVSLDIDTTNIKVIRI